MLKQLLLFLLAVSIVHSSLFDSENQQAGILDLGEGDDMFYWLFRSRSETADKDPLIIWLTGGPGCSSEMAVFYENGPFQINDDLSLKTNEYSWNTRANLLFIDQPLGTGFSKTKNPLHFARNEKMVAQAFYRFLVKFYANFPEFKRRELHITGESYAGHYIPAIADYLVENPLDDVNLQGVAIGNGWTSPYDQYPQYAEFALENKLISYPAYLAFKAGFKICQGLISTGVWPVAFYECQLGVSFITGNPLAPSFNLYDIRKKCEHPPLCYDFSNLDKYLALENVREELHVGKRSWSSCNMVVHFVMLGDWTTNMKTHVRNLLEKKVRVLVYSGDRDYVCNWRGGEAWTHSLDWTGKEDFNNSEYNKWIVDGEEAGEFKKVDNFTFLRVYDAGHMVPMDQPKRSLVMIDQMVNRDLWES